jgi:hypothetical protein
MSFARSLHAALVLVATASAAADRPPEVRKAEKTPPTGEEILNMVRMSQALQDLRHLKGKLRIEKSDIDEKYEGQVYPFDLTMSDNIIRFIFPDPPKEIINLDLNERGTTLTRVTGAGRIEMPSSLYGERVRQTAINFEDLSMRFLYWPNAKVVGEESPLPFQKCWVVRVVNPDSRGPYRQVDVWVHKESGGMLQMRAYDGRGRLLKEFKVKKGQKYKDAYILKQMRVESRNAASNEVVGRTYLEIADPD